MPEAQCGFRRFFLVAGLLLTATVLLLSGMASRLSIIFYILLCLEIGLALVILPWYQPFGGDWGNNYFLFFMIKKTGWQGLQTIVASGWVRGAVTGLGALNIFLAFREIFNFRQSVREMDNQTANKLR